MISCIGNLGKVGIAGTTVATNQQINGVIFHKELVDENMGSIIARLSSNGLRIMHLQLNSNYQQSKFLKRPSSFHLSLNKSISWRKSRN